MSLDVYLTEIRRVTIFEANITHNLGKMAGEVGLYYPVWRPDEMFGAEIAAANLIGPIETGLKRLILEKDPLQALNPPNGWGTYYTLLQFTENYLAACKLNPDAQVEVSR